MTETEYLTFENAAKDRHLYVDGEIFAMATESPEHGDITTNLVGSLHPQIKGTPCRARFKETRVRSGPISASRRSARGMYSYPDVVVICGEPEYLKEDRNTVLNPNVIIEVLSPATETFDRGGKFDRYQTHNPTLTDYILVAQDRPCVEHFHRVDKETWTYRRVLGLKGKVIVKSIGVILKLADVYDRVTFKKDQ
ncbi:MAG: Uma2 family endonuclease [Gemmataceae bacterium]